MEKNVRAGLIWRYDIDYSIDNIDEIVENISKEFSEAENQPTSIEINTNNYGIVVAERLLSMGLPIQKMVRLKKGWAYA